MKKRSFLVGILTIAAQAFVVSSSLWAHDRVIDDPCEAAARSAVSRYAGSHGYQSVELGKVVVGSRFYTFHLDDSVCVDVMTKWCSPSRCEVLVVDEGGCG